MYAISKDFAFSASHQLSGLPADHPCSRLHGHNYIIRLTLQGDTNEIGFVTDYRELDSFKQWIDSHLDHRHLNNVFDFNPTAENMAHFMYQYCHTELGLTNVHEVSVSETPKTWATFTEWE